MSTRLIESMPQLGGQLAALYPEKYIYDIAGFPKVEAQDMVNNLQKQMSKFNSDVKLGGKVKHLRKLADRHFEVITDNGVYNTKSIIITAGVGAFESRRLELPGAAKYEGVNLQYFVQDLERYRGKKVLISGGGDSAIDWALKLEPIAESVLLVHRRDKFRDHEHSVELLEKSSVKVIVPSEIVNLHEEERIEHVTLADVKSKAETIIDVDSVIVTFGFVSSLGPITEWGLNIDNGSIVVDSRMETNSRAFLLLVI